VGLASSATTLSAESVDGKRTIIFFLGHLAPFSSQKKKGQG